jgi:hypothetical protein
VLELKRAFFTAAAIAPLSTGAVAWLTTLVAAALEYTDWLVAPLL